MKEEIKKILQDYSLTDLPLNDATQRVLDLFAVMQRSEQLPCDYCEETKPLKYCQECWEKLEQFKQCY